MTESDSESELIFVPLGGSGEIGMNLNLYGFRGQWILVDCGITFADAALPGIDILMPDPTFIAERKDDLIAIVLTHAHEDHLGAVAHLWPRLECPVYATPFTVAILRRKLEEAGLLDRVPVNEVTYGEALALGPFTVTYLGITHSVPEGSSLAIRTDAGTILHTGDWKLDPEPLVGTATDEAAFRTLGDDGVLAMVCDSTNVFSPGSSGSEAAVRNSLMELVDGRTGRVAITTFASNVARVATAAAVAQAHERELVVIGRSLLRTIEAAQSVGYLLGLPTVLSVAEAAYLPRERVLLLCTGCQGEPRGAMARIADGEHPDVALETGDLVIFSSKIIPGNEAPIGRMVNLLVEAGVEILTEDDHFLHVSGHPGREELAELYSWVRPEISVPVHGEARHLAEHVAYAKRLGVPHCVLVSNGAVVRLAPGPAEIVDHVGTGRLALDGGNLVHPDSAALRARKRLMHHGYVSVTLVMDSEGALLAVPRVNPHGVAEHREGALARGIEAALVQVVEALATSHLRDDLAVENAVRRQVNQIVRPATGKRPLVDVDIVRLPPAAYESRPGYFSGGLGR